MVFLSGKFYYDLIAELEKGPQPRDRRRPARAVLPAARRRPRGGRRRLPERRAGLGAGRAGEPGRLAVLHHRDEQARPARGARRGACRGRVARDRLRQAPRGRAGRPGAPRADAVAAGSPRARTRQADASRSVRRSSRLHVQHPRHPCGHGADGTGRGRGLRRARSDSTSRHGRPVVAGRVGLRRGVAVGRKEGGVVRAIRLRRRRRSVHAVLPFLPREAARPPDRAADVRPRARGACARGTCRAARRTPR